ISPVLFLLYTAPLHQLPLKSSSFGYADDVALLACDKSLAGSTHTLQRDVGLILDWAQRNGLAFDPGKSELLHFSRRRERHNPRVDRPGWNVEPAPTDATIRWLGVHFDRRLSFHPHARIARQRAMNAVGTIRGLGNTVKGASPHALRAAAVACVLPTLFYAVETWWPVPGVRRRWGSAALEGEVQAVLSATSRAILPVWRTTPTPAISREAGLPPARAWLDLAAGRASLRLRRLDHSHPLVTRVRMYEGSGTPTSPEPCTRLVRLSEITTNVETVPPDPTLPWETRPDYQGAVEQIGFSPGERDVQANRFSNWLASLPSSDLVVYSDGSRLAGNKTGAACVGFQGSTEVLRASISLGDAVEVPDAEALGVAAALTAAANRDSHSAIHVCLDNLSVAARASCPTLPTRSSAWVFDQIRIVSAGSPVPVGFR